jgi:Trp operon repressor
LERLIDTDQPINTIRDPLHVSIVPITRSKTKAMKEAMNELVRKVLARADFGDPLEH